MKKIALIRLTVCLIFAIVFVVSGLTLADIASGTNKKAEQHFEKANELLKRMDYEAAIAEYSKVISLSSGSKIAQDAQYWIGQSHFRAGQFDAAQETFAKLIEEHPASAIVPVAKLMVGRVRQAKENEENRRAMSDAADKGYVIDPSTGVKYTRVATFVGKNDIMVDTIDSNKLGFVQLSPNGKFLLYGKLVVPMDGSDPFDLVDMSATRTTWSPDGRNVAFYSGDAICMVPVSPETGRPTGPVKKLLDGRYKWGTKVSWSPDGEKLAFSRAGDREQGIFGGDIWILSIKDGSLTQITNGPAIEYGPKWSPDGETIVYAMRERGNRLSFCSISAKGGAPKKIIEPGGRCIPFWSPDGKWILYKLGEIIHLFGLNDNQKLKMIPPREVGDFFSLSPEGKKMLFYRPSYGYSFGLKLVSASGGPPLDLGREHSFYQAMGFYGALVWSDNRRLIAMGDNEENIVFWIISLSGDDPVPLEMDVSVVGRPLPIAVSPNAKKLAFVVKRDDGVEDLFVVPISLQDACTTGSAVKVFEGWDQRIGYNATVNWSPDGNKLAVIHEGDVWIAYSNGDKPVQITKTPKLELYPAWSPDGKMVDYTIYSGESHVGLYVVPASGGETTKILGASSRNSAWSPDSKGLTVVFNGLISTVPMSGGKSQQIAKLKDLGLKSVLSLRWSPDGKHIACVGNHIEKDDSGPIFVIPAEGGKATMLATDDNSYKNSLSWSPDGRWITYDSHGPVKVRPEGTMWEADFEEIVKKASR